MIQFGSVVTISPSRPHAHPEAPLLSAFTALDLVALGVFLAAWLLHTWLAEASRFKPRSLNHGMMRQRAAWIRQMSERDLRMIDTAIMAGLQNGTAFFASTSLLAIGGCFALLNATERVITVLGDLPFGVPVLRGAFEMKVFLLGAIYAYAFFKFGWAYRLFNYASILIGAVPGRHLAGTPEMEGAIRRATAFTQQAGVHFNRGLRAFFMSIGYLGWFLGPQALIASALLVLAVLIRRQFFSTSRHALYTDDPA